MQIEELKKKAIHGLMWSAAQSWGSKILTFVLFIILARVVSPAEFGLIAAALIIMLFIDVFAELGFGDALIQRPKLEDHDINLPFFVSMAISTLLAGAVVLASQQLEIWMAVPGLASVITAVGLLAPVTTASLFQVVLYRRQLKFKQLAMRTLFGTALSGVVACAGAFAGWGVWALVAQLYIMTFINFIWLWARPVWLPSFKFNPETFKSIVHFGYPLFGMRLLDLVAVRAAEIVVVTLFGVATLGLYTGGTKLLQVLLMLFQSVLSDVALTILSKIAHDKEKMRALYLNTITLSIAALSPIFMLLAAIAPEVCSVLYGEKWVMIDHLVRPFLMLGAVQCVQLLNGSYFSATGQTKYLLYLNILKVVAIAPVFFFSHDEDIFTFVIYFCISQTIVTLPSFFLAGKVLDIPLKQILSRFAPFVVASVIGFSVVLLTHDFFVNLINSTFIRGIVLGIFFVVIYGMCVMLMARERIFSIIAFIKQRART